MLILKLKFVLIQFNLKVIKNLQPYLIMVDILQLTRQVIQSCHHLESLHYCLQFTQYLNPLDTTLTCCHLFNHPLHQVSTHPYLIISS